MGFASFVVHYLVSNLPLYVAIFIPSLFIGYVIERHVAINKVELLYNWQWICCISFSIADVVFLYLLSKITSLLLWNFIFTEIIYYFILLYLQSFFLLKRRYNFLCKKTTIDKKSDNARFYIYVLFILDILLSILKVRFLGVRSFEKQGGGTGAILRLQWVISPLSTYSVIYACFSKNKKKYFILLFIKIFFILLGNSRSAMLGMFLSVLLFYFLNPSNRSVKKFIKKYLPFLIILSILGALLIIFLMSDNGNFFSSFLTLVYRFIAFGDVYTWAYPENVILKVSENLNVSFFKYLFSDLLSTFRLLPRVIADETNLSGKLVEYVAGPGIPEGPNARFNVIGLAFFGFSGSLLFSVFCALVFVFAHIRLIKGVNASFKKQLFAVMIFSLLRDLQQDSILIPQFITEFTIFISFMFVMGIVEIACKNTTSKI